MRRTLNIAPIAMHTLLCSLLLLAACTSPRTYSTRYYKHNKGTLDSIISSYREITAGKPLSIGFTDPKLTHLSFELFTGELRIIKEFNIADTAAIVNTLHEYHYPVARVAGLLSTMKRIHSHWISTDSYYIPFHDTAYMRGNYTFVSIKPTDFHAPFSNSRYYVLVYMQPGFSRDSLTQPIIQKSGLRQLAPAVFYKVSDRFR
ncbi:hypothetical protein [Deminuibacter soli]|uniref:Lipoprotein n=1 Tax=Deminuibacter soli TaxID=2291815 RepID=A0A3E1NEE5_9BACT|nr:hypothetical protein [Deminuibacter soli]RFM26148.1 hypothetical protein DXN05_21340 [Deminuibacter soli]